MVKRNKKVTKSKASTFKFSKECDSILRKQQNMTAFIEQLVMDSVKK